MTKINNKPSISVALCTFNGEKYIKDQLNSIVAQQIKPSEIIICDDNSNDRTIEIIEQFKKTTRISVKIIKNQKQLGVVKNFEKAISHCSSKYIFLSDQDDIWLSNKIGLTIDVLTRAESKYSPKTPILVYTDLFVTDSNCKVIASSFMKSQCLHHIESNALKTLVVQNFVTGCTVAMNKALVELALPIPDGVIMHDWWFALIAASCGQLLFVNQPTIYYRQHSKNVVGAKNHSLMSRVLRLIQIDNISKNIARTIYQTKMLKERAMLHMSNESLTLINNHLNNMSKGGIIAVINSIKLGIKKEGNARNIIFMLLLLTSRYKRFL